MTKYFEYPTGWDVWHKEFPGATLDSFTAEMMVAANRRKLVSSWNQVVCERLWIKLGRPYYKVDDAATQMFRKINIDLPFSYLKFPFDVFAIYFSETCPIQTRFGPMRSMLVQNVTSEQSTDNTPKLYLWVDCGERGGVVATDPIINYLNVDANPNDSIEKSLVDLPVGKLGSTIMEDGVDKDLIAIAISVCFLATSSDKIIRPDVLSKDLAMYANAMRKNDHEHIRVITERAHRRGKVGYFVDGEREYIHKDHEPSEGNPTGRELLHRHVRSAHFRRLSSGVVTFVRQHMVRPDLPART